jgi:hypothetical protein
MADDGSVTVAPVGEVFISYSWDSDEHINAVREFADRLRSEGIDAIIDQYEESPPDGWPRWMDKKIRDSRLVLLVCTEDYYKGVMGEASPKTRLGVRWEGGLIYQHLYNEGINQKFIPVLFKDGDKKFIPTPVQSATHYRVDTSQGYDKLYARLLNRPTSKKPKLGPIWPMPKREVKTDLSMYVTGPINVDLWNEARWRGTIFLFFENAPPALGLAFRNEKAARQIFEDWHKRYGQGDKFEELRISIIEGEITGEQPGYTVHVSVDFENTVRRYRASGLTIDVENSMFAMISRINRMNPAPGSKNLGYFKDAYRHYKTYTLIPAILSSDDSSAKPILDLGIFKNTIHFRQASDIDPEHDPDAPALGMGTIERPSTPYGKRHSTYKKRKGKNPKEERRNKKKNKRKK